MLSFKVYSLFKVDSQNAEQEAVDKLGTWRVCSVDKEADKSSVFLPGGLVLHIELAKRTSEDEHWERPDLLQNPEPAKVASAVVRTVLLNFTRPAVRSHVIIESSFSISAHSCCLQVPLILSELLTVLLPPLQLPTCTHRRQHCGLRAAVRILGDTTKSTDFTTQWLSCGLLHTTVVYVAVLFLSYSYLLVVRPPLFGQAAHVSWHLKPFLPTPRSTGVPSDSPSYTD